MSDFFSHSDSSQNRHAGFTLIELLVVISIIALLVAILLPALAAARESGRAIQCSSQLRQIHLGAAMYADDWDGGKPSEFWYYDLNPGLAHSGFRDYLGVRESFNEDTVFTCPSIQLSANRAGGLLNRNYSANWRATYEHSTGGRPLRLHEITKPSSMAFFMDGRINNLTSVGWSYYTVVTHGGRTTLNFVHDKTINVAYVDGHGGRVQQTFVLALPNQNQVFWEGR